MIFGSACSFTTDIFARERFADKFAADEVATKDLIYDAFYMDNSVHSFLDR